MLDCNLPERTAEHAAQAAAAELAAELAAVVAAAALGCCNTGTGTYFHRGISYLEQSACRLVGSVGARAALRESHSIS